MRKRSVSLFFTLAAIIALIFQSLSAQQTDPFYLNILENAQKSFLAKNYPDAARNFEIAAFGLIENKTLQAKAKAYLGLCQYYLNDLAACEKSLREAAELMEDEGLVSLEIYESARPDLNRLVAFFNLTPPQNEAPSRETEKPLSSSSKAQSTSPGEPFKKPAEKTSLGTPKDESRDTITVLPSDLNIDELKTGDLVPLDLVDTQPVLIKSIPATYPAYARPLRIEGTVILNALISEKGNVIQTEIVQGIPNAVGFDQSARRAVRQWKFEPASIKGIKVKVWTRVAVEFRRSTGLPE